MTLRPYQHEAITSIVASHRQGVTRQLVTLPTGTGKTIIFSHLPRALAFRGRTLVIAHREELIDQAANKMRTNNPDAGIGIEMADRTPSAGDSIVVASVQSLAARLNRYEPGAFRLVVCDESHHAVAPSYRRVFDAFGLMDGDPDRLLVGFTATTGRGDGQGLGQVFERITYSRSLREMIAEGWLADIAGYRISTDSDLSGVRTVAGDFAVGQLAAAVNTPARNRLIVETYLELAPQRKALAFTVDVQHASDLAGEFQRQGVRAKAVSGQIPKAERRAIVQAYRDREIEILCNCALLTEGFDDPATDAVLMARPTRSKVLYQQMLGRGTRPAPGKSDLLVLDFADLTRRHDVVSLPSLFGLNPALNLKGKMAAETVTRVESAGVDACRYDDIEQLERSIERIDFFRVSELPAEIAAGTRFSWVPILDGVLRLSLPDRRSLTIVENQLDQHEVWTANAGAKRRHGEFPDVHQAIAYADSIVPPGSLGAILREACWRDDKPSEKQIRLAERLGIPVPANTTKGELGQMISAFFGRREAVA
jgi:superfamily II DNA or RNA helicase